MTLAVYTGNPLADAKRNISFLDKKVKDVVRNADNAGVFGCLKNCFWGMHEMTEGLAEYMEQNKALTAEEKALREEYVELTLKFYAVVSAGESQCRVTKAELESSKSAMEHIVQSTEDNSGNWKTEWMARGGWVRQAHLSLHLARVC